jgi:hypothetical protein
MSNHAPQQQSVTHVGSATGTASQQHPYTKLKLIACSAALREYISKNEVNANIYTAISTDNTHCNKLCHPDDFSEK